MKGSAVASRRVHRVSELTAHTLSSSHLAQPATPLMLLIRVCVFCVFISVYKCVYVCEQVCEHVCVCVFVCVFVCVCHTLLEIIIWGYDNILLMNCVSLVFKCPCFLTQAL